MVDRIVINTSPLITFGKMNIENVISQLPFNFICPKEVADEVTMGYALGYPVPLPTWLTVLPLATPLLPLSLLTIDAGEAAVIQLAIEQSI